MPNELMPIDDLDVIQIIGADGQPMEIRPLDDSESTINTYDSSRMWRLIIKNDEDDERLENVPSGTLGLVKDVRALDSETGEGVVEKEVIIIGQSIPVAYLLSKPVEERTWFKDRYQPGTENLPACQSADAKRPNTQYVAAGTCPSAGGLCVGKNQKSQVVAVCPMAATSQDGNGKFVPSPCKWALKAAFAVPLEEGGWVVFETKMKGIATTGAKQLMNSVAAISAMSKKAYHHPCTITGIKREGQKGRAYVAIMQPEASELTDEQFAELEQFAEMWRQMQGAYVARAKGSGSPALPAPAGVPQLVAGTRNATPDETTAELDRVFAPAKDDSLF